MNFKQYIETTEIIHMFCDMDGVLTNWEKHFIDSIGKPIDEIPKKESYKITADLPIEWWETMPWMDDGKELWSFLSENFSSLHILSSPTSDKEQKSVKGKWKWLEKEGIVQQLGEENIIIAQEKHKYVRQEGISILVDDKEKKINKWKEAGGIGILHTSAQKSINELKKHLKI